MTDDQVSALMMASLARQEETLGQIRDLLVVIACPPEPSRECAHPEDTRVYLDKRAGREEWICNAKDDKGVRCGYHARTAPQLTPT